MQYEIIDRVLRSCMNKNAKEQVLSDIPDKVFLYRLIRCIAPTIAGKKPAALMNISINNGGLIDIWDHYRTYLFKESRIDYYELKRTDKNVIVLFFNPQLLNNLLKKISVQKFLSECGYECYSINYTLDILKQRYTTCSCPSEIGIFLGIPLKDVKGFMGLNSLSYTKSGMWKIYGNPTVSEKRMNEYRSGRNMILERLMQDNDPVNIIRSGESILCQT